MPKAKSKGHKAKTRTAGEGPCEKTIQEQDSAPSASFPVVGIGSSAGGLEALEAFFNSVPAESGIAYVVISHLDPYHPSVLTELLSHYTSMEVVEAHDRARIRPDRVYVLPPGKEMILKEGTLRVFERHDDGEPHMPIDQFLRSLAEDQGINAIAVILSGNSTDGSFGLRAVKGNMGMGMAQDPDTARYDNMPRSAIATGLVDYVLAPDEMPQQIVNYLRTLTSRIEKEQLKELPGDKEAVSKILNIVMGQTGHDFSLYKRNTVCRRIERRMNVHQIATKSAYADLLQKDQSEANTLFKELLIQVTRFFRDQEAFEALKHVLRKEVLERKPEGSDLRVWVPGCSSGEEAFSIAMVLSEIMQEMDKRFSVQIFGTDIDDGAIDIARAGVYPASIASDVGQRRLDRFFMKEDGKLKVKKEIREMAIFAPQNAIRDPPFVRLDLISCRNLLIYFEPVLQRKLLETMTFALNPGAILFLGTSESVDGYTDDYAALDNKWKVFQRKSYVQAPASRELAVVPAQRARAPTLPKPEQGLNVRAAAEDVMLQDFTPSSIVVNSKDEIVFFHGRTGKFLEPSPGKASLSLQLMLKEDVRFAVLSALREARRKEKVVVKIATKVATNGDSTFLNVVVAPLGELKGIGGMLVVFQEVLIPRGVLKEHQDLAIAPDKDSYIKELEKELSYTKESLQSTIEELETSNEELKSTNEELQSTNEELQSVAEESETAKEELHSLNEELMSVNAELEKRNQDLTSAASDWRNLLNSIDVAVIFLDGKLRIKRFTPQVERVINLIGADIGRPIKDIVINLEYDDLVKDAAEVLDRLSTKEREVQTKEGHWFTVKLLPYRTVDNVIEGVVITFQDIDAQKRTQVKLEQMAKEIQSARRYAEGVVDSMKVPMVVLDDRLRIVSANIAFRAGFGLGKENLTGMPIARIGNGVLDNRHLLDALENSNARGKGFSDREIELALPSGARKIRVNASKIRGESELVILEFEFEH
ncbi:MAG TPA: chemotaxis protein CheB [Methanomassiliicoccales archaeon]|nr:chemotaxis protein CheB [Methanomassiliicoccales archaeon]